MNTDTRQPGAGKKNPFRLANTRDQILAVVPHYPESVKGYAVRILLRARHGLVFTDATWHNWVTRLTQAHPARYRRQRVSVPRHSRANHSVPQPTPQYLIRLPGNLLSRPRTPVDIQHHVPPFTPKPKALTRTLAQELKAAHAKSVANLYTNNS